MESNLLTAAPARTVHVLLIEDSEADRELVRRFLAPTDHQRFDVAAAPTLGQGLTDLSGAVPDCVLLDLSLPDAVGLDGLTVLRERVPTVPVIVLTGHDDDVVGEASLGAGAQDFIAKSDLKGSILRRAIGHAITRQRQQRLLEAAYEDLAQEAQERRQAEAALQRSAAELERSNRELSQFAYVAAHDLRSPLGTVSGYTELLAELPGVAGDPDAAEVIDHIHVGVRRMRALIEDLLAYCSIGAGPLRREPVDLGRLAAEVCASATERRPGAVVELGELPTVMGDRGQLCQLLDNLVTNALTFVPDDRRPELSVTAEPGGDGWHVVVADNGIGIAPAERERVFGMFQRADGVTDYAGTGIGLAICQRVVEQHRGRIWVEDNRPCGTRMCVRLPLAP